MRRGSVALAVVLLAALANAAQAATPQRCQASELFELARKPKGVLRDFDGDGVPDRLQLIADESGSGFYSAQVELELSTLRRVVRIDTGQSFESFLSFTEIPQDLQGSAMRTARDAVAAVLFNTVCSAPDPSLAWLLDGRALRWQNGPPQHPDNYIIESANVAIAPGRGQWTQAEMEVPRGPVWIGYLGINHQRSLSKSDLSGDFKVLADRPGQQLLGTAHGVVLLDTQRNRHAWIYVQAGGQKLRWPTIASARFDGGRALITVKLDVAQRNGVVAVDLASGRATPSFCDVDAWDPKARTCSK